MKPISKKQEKQLFRIPLHIKIVAAIALVAVLLIARFSVSLIVPAEANNIPQANATSLPQPLPQPQYRLQTPLSPFTPPLEDQLAEVLNSWVETVGEARLGIQISALDGSYGAAYNSYEVFKAASLYKTLAAYGALQRVDKGELSLTMQIEEAFSLQDCIDRAITLSDNPCGAALQRWANPYILDTQLQERGFNETTISGIFPVTSARDQQRLFTEIYSEERLSAASQEILLEALRNQQVLNRTPDYANATAYVKTGDLDDIVNSTTLVASDEHAYVISVLSEDWDVSLWEKYTAIKQLHEEVHDVIHRN